MNTPKRPSISCRMVRGWSACFGSGEGSAPTGIGSRHVERCEFCQAYYASCSDFDALLRSDAAKMRVTTDGLDRQIIAAVRSSRREPDRRVSRRAPLFAVAGALAAVVVAAVFVVRQPKPGPVIASNQPTPDAAEVWAAARSFSSEVWGSVKPSAVALTERNPLQDEINSVYSDARGAVDFLALNFLPNGRTDASHSSGSGESQG